MTHSIDLDLKRMKKLESGITRLQKAAMWKHARLITDQHYLDVLLMELPNMHARRVAFELIKPMLKFEAVFNESKYLPPERKVVEQT